ACRAISQSAARLACFDRESAGLAAAHQAAAAPRTGPSGLTLSPHQTFGLPEGAIEEREISAGVRARPLTRISARVSRLSESPDGRLVFALDNGQVWMELLPDRDLLAQPGETATIHRQLFGSYWMELQSGRGCKVTRVR
ncbi:MAG: hypothetical protein KGJ72_05945, partial [Gammaproteobacteria bacterium]|nr:hypothetical protein [Gammaproteobacteria bacterium]